MNKKNPFGLTDKELAEVLTTLKDLRSVDGEREMTLMQYIYLGVEIINTAFRIGIKRGASREDSTYILNEVASNIRYNIYKLTDNRKS